MPVKSYVRTSIGRTDLERQDLRNYEEKLNTANERRLWEHLGANKKAEELLRENSLLKENINQIMQRLKHLEKTNKMEIIEPKENEFYTDEEELERETDWIIKSSRKNKKRKANASPEISPQQGTSFAENSNINLNPIQTRKEEKKLEPPPINVLGIKEYRELHALTQEITKNFKVTTLNNNVMKINVSQDEEYRKLTRILTEKKIQWYSYENKNDRPLKVMARGLHPTCKPEEIIEDL